MPHSCNMRTGSFPLALAMCRLLLRSFSGTLATEADLRSFKSKQEVVRGGEHWSSKHRYHVWEPLL